MLGVWEILTVYLIQHCRFLERIPNISRMGVAKCFFSVTPAAWTFEVVGRMSLGICDVLGMNRSQPPILPA